MLGRTDALEDACPLFRQATLIFRFIARHHDEFPVERVCRVLDVSISGYYALRGRPDSERIAKDRSLTARIRKSFEDSRGTYGALRIKADLCEQGEQVSRERIGRLIRQAQLVARGKQKFRTTTKAKSSHPVAENLLARNFDADDPNQKWATDITYLPTREGWLYLATVMNLYSRKIVGWALNERLHTPLVTAALGMAVERRQPPGGLLHHSDRGSQYTSEVYKEALDRLHAVQSMSEKGECWDSAVQESFFATLKTELELGKAQWAVPRHERRSSSGLRCSTTASVVTPRWATGPRRPLRSKPPSRTEPPPNP
ncbi:IS3 family transposase (plasmid) [Deinococcus psychrotolerans]|uniref:IS3 family transposase n=1 Tax=Deinococcus psychrotolerans TaxID=2489213 RepID=A0A3G8YL44_9DEIO|nr:IS3 family transposase [Deinococcus psychrotolerans]